jgi:hypothetical protein
MLGVGAGADSAQTFAGYVGRKLEASGIGRSFATFY